MRSPRRIPVILARLQKAWEACPDMRLGQMVTCTKGDPFNAEDEDLVSQIEKLMGKSTVASGWQGRK